MILTIGYARENCIRVGAFSGMVVETLLFGLFLGGGGAFLYYRI